MLAVLAVYVAADILLEGPAAAAAVMAAGVLEVVLLRILGRRREPAPLVEAAALALLVLLSWLLGRAGYGGSAWPLMELLLGGALAVSALRGRPWLLSMAERAGFPLPGGSAMRRASLVLGVMLLVHGLFLAVMVLLDGSPPLLAGIVSLALLYLGALAFIRRSSGRGEAAPTLERGGDSELVLFSPSGTELGRLELDPGAVCRVRVREIAGGVDPHELLGCLEEALRGGARVLCVESWPADPMALRLSGYREGERGFRKPIAP